MGRHAGFLTAAAAAWRLDAGQRRRISSTCPERPFSCRGFIDDVARDARPPQALHRRRVRRRQDARRAPAASKPGRRRHAERDAHGNVQLSGSDLGIEIQSGPESAASQGAGPRRHVRLPAAGLSRRHRRDRSARGLRRRRLRGRARHGSKRLGGAGLRWRDGAPPRSWRSTSSPARRVTCRTRFFSGAANLRGRTALLRAPAAAAPRFRHAVRLSGAAPAPGP